MKIFLSSTYQDLLGHREAAARAIERLGQQGVRMEVFGARPAEATDACLQEISGSDALVGIYAHRYGYVPPGHSKSITEQEFNYAREKDKPTFHGYSSSIRKHHRSMLKRSQDGRASANSSAPPSNGCRRFIYYS